MPFDQDNTLSDWATRAHRFQQQIKKVVLGLDDTIELMAVAVFARGHVMLEGDVGVGKTTLLRAVARCIGGAFERIEGTIDLMPNDLVYHTYINENGKPHVDPGPVLKHGESLATFFFNEVNRARPQVHSLLLRIMAERSVTAFNQEYQFPHLQIFADRNRVEKEETFEIPSAARDRFMMELHVETPNDPEICTQLMLDPRFHDVDRLIESIESGVLPYRQLNRIAEVIQNEIQSSKTLQRYALDLWNATREPQKFGVKLEHLDLDQLILAGASARGMSMLMRAARVCAWMRERTVVVPEDIQYCFYETMAHRIFFKPTYEIRRESIIRPLIGEILDRVAAP